MSLKYFLSIWWKITNQIFFKDFNHHEESVRFV